MEPLILIIDDDEKLNGLLCDYLGNYGYRAIAVSHPGDGLEKLKTDPPDLIILDIMLPDMDGFAVCKTIRRSHEIPIIMLTARGEVTDRVVGLELGADDYLAKPFEPRELVARIQSVLRRSASRKTAGSETATSFNFGRLTVDMQKQEAWLDGERVALTTNEFNALALLVRITGNGM